MKRFIRFKGLVAFVIIIVVFGIFWFFFVDGIVKRLIQKYGTQAVGARVEVGAADLSLFPVGLKLEHLEVTDPDSPMKNAVEINRISLSLEPSSLFRRKIIVKEMLVDGIQLQTPRKTSGAIRGKKKPEKAQEPGKGAEKKRAG